MIGRPTWLSQIALFSRTNVDQHDYNRSLERAKKKTPGILVSYSKPRTIVGNGKWGDGRKTTISNGETPATTFTSSLVMRAYSAQAFFVVVIFSSVHFAPVTGGSQSPVPEGGSPARSLGAGVLSSPALGGTGAISPFALLRGSPL